MASRAIEAEVDRLIDERPGRELLDPVYDEKAVEVAPGIFRSAGTTASYMLVTSAGRVIVNTGMGWETPHHKHLFDAVCPGPTPYIVTTQGHVDHVGGVGQLRGPETRYVAHANNPACQADDKRLVRFRARTAMRWFPHLPARIAAFAKRYPDAKPFQDEPTPDVMFDDRMRLRAGDLDIELLHAPGGETIDSLIVWLPQRRTAIVSNLFGPLFPHFPNFNTLRGDKYRFPVPYMANVDRMRALAPATLITGRHLPIEGEELVDACLARMRGAVEHVHERTLAAMNEGKDAYEIMREASLPAELRVGQGYGKVAWAARTFFEEYTGWFRRRSTAELYGCDPADTEALLARLAGADAVVAEAEALLARGDAPGAIRLAEAALATSEGNARAARVMLGAHEHLLANGGDESFWESGWLRHEAERWRRAVESDGR
ncbi:MAG: alkyl sulfatase dimerization domain-containing protein [Myxococcota bacterium]|nr:MBL fold metallo-hydrolase [Myxococcales bacterium]